MHHAVEYIFILLLLLLHYLTRQQHVCQEMLLEIQKQSPYLIPKKQKAMNLADKNPKFMTFYLSRLITFANTFE